MTRKTVNDERLCQQWLPMHFPWFLFLPAVVPKLRPLNCKGIVFVPPSLAEIGGTITIGCTVFFICPRTSREFLLSKLLYLNYESATKPVYMYINTPGTSTPDGRAIGFETEAFAISDTMNYIKPPVYTIGVGQVR